MANLIIRLSWQYGYALDFSQINYALDFSQMNYSKKKFRNQGLFRSLVVDELKLKDSCFVCLGLFLSRHYLGSSNQIVTFFDSYYFPSRSIWGSTGFLVKMVFS